MREGTKTALGIFCGYIIGCFAALGIFYVLMILHDLQIFFF